VASIGPAVPGSSTGTSSQFAEGDPQPTAAATFDEYQHSLRRLVREQHRAHREYLRTQQQAHQDFLAGRFRAIDLFVTRAPDSPQHAGAAANAKDEEGQIKDDRESIPGSTLILPPLSVPRGPAFSRQQLEILTGGTISEVFGKLFAQQDRYLRQVRMPMPP